MALIINMFRPCSLCPGKAMNQCLCSNQYFCERHCLEHLRTGGNHNFISVTLQLDSEKRRQMTEELFSRIQVIDKCKVRIAAHTSYLMNKIGELSNRAIENLSKLALNYHKLMTTNEFSGSQMEELNTILSDEFQLKFDPALETVYNIEQYFAQDFCSQSKLKRFLQSHTAEIWCVAATNDHHTIFFGGDDRTIKLCGVASKKVTNLLEGHTKTVSSIAISKDDRYLASGSWDRTVRVWSVSELRQLFVLEGHTKRVLCVAVSDDSRWIASASADYSVCVWSFAEQRLHIKLTEHTSWVNAVAFTGSSLFSGSSDKRIIEWDINSFNQRSVLETTSTVRCLDISRDQTQIVCGLFDGGIQLWQNRALQAQFTGHTECVYAVKFVCNNKRIISASDDHSVRVWSIEQRCQLASFTDHSSSATCLAILGDDLFVSGSWDFSMIVWDASTLTRNSVIRPQPVKFSKIVYDENRLIYPSVNSVRIWNVDRNCEDAEFQGHSSVVECVDLHCNLIVSGSRDKSVRVWSLATGLQVAALTGHTGFVLAVAMCGDIIASGSGDKTVRLWSLQTKKETGVLSGHTHYVWSVALTSSADTVVSSSSDKTVRIWSVSRLQLLFTLTGHLYWVEGVGLSKDDKYIFSGSESEECVRVWEIKSGVEVCCLNNLNEVNDWMSNYPEMRRITELFIS